MCLALYIASPKPLPVVPWDPKKPAFHVIPLPEDRGELHEVLAHPHIYYVGSHEGCSCAFNYEHEFKSALELQSYLRKALTVTEEIEGFSCRPGQNTPNVKHSVTISPTGVALPEFFFQDGQRLVFRSRKTMAAQRRRTLSAVPMRQKRIRATQRGKK